jgi:hypothetical protein
VDGAEEDDGGLDAGPGFAKEMDALDVPLLEALAGGEHSREWAVFVREGVEVLDVGLVVVVFVEPRGGDEGWVCQCAK